MDSTLSAKRLLIFVRIATMIKLKAYKYRLKPRAEQHPQFDQHFGHVRFVKNWAITLKGRYYRRFGKGLSSRRLQDQLVKKKKLAKYQWLSDINSQALLAALMDVETAFKKFFNGAGYPKRKKKYAAWQSFQAPQHVEATKNKIKLPKIGWVDCVMHRDLPEGKIKTCTIKRAPSGKYFISVLIEQQVNEVIPCVIEEDKTIGVDVGIKTFAILNKHMGLKLSDRVFVCPTCNHTEDRDLHASHNIKRFGLQKVFEAAGSVVTVKRSPSSKRVKARGDAKGADILSSGQSKPPLERDSV
jgi:transposase